MLFTSIANRSASGVFGRGVAEAIVSDAAGNFGLNREIARRVCAEIHDQALDLRLGKPLREIRRHEGFCLGRDAC